MHSLIEISHVVLSMYFATSSLSPLEKGVALHLNKIESPLHKNAFVSSLVEMSPVVKENKMNYGNVFSLLCCYYPPLEKDPLFVQS